jgi:uncharacterized membrane protein
VKSIRLDAVLLVGVGILAYSLLAYLSTATRMSHELPGLGMVVALAPILAVLGWMAWLSPRRGWAMAAMAAVLGLLALAWAPLERNVNWLYFLQHVGSNLFLAWFFGQSLARERVPMCTRFAMAAHGDQISSAVRVYSRQVTWVWTGFFLAISALSTLLFLFASIQAWSVFANFLSMPLVGVLFVVEYLVRLRVLPETHHGRFIDSLTAYWHNRGDTPPGA